jgi:subtilase family serine protease
MATVITVGGTTLTQANNARGWSETAWSGTGSGCSTVIKKPVWQKDTGCVKRTLTDVAFLGNPQTGLAFYDSNSQDGPPGWYVGGGTSLSAPAIASIYAMAGLAASDASSIYQAAGTGALNPITSGSNGTCTPQYLCTAGAGYNGPTGNGTPYGAGAF